MKYAKKRIHIFVQRITAVLLACAMVVPAYSAPVVYAEEVVQTTALPEGTEYIYMDLAAGNVAINGSTYTGSIFVSDGSGGYKAESFTGTHKADNHYYIYQSTLTESQAAVLMMSAPPVLEEEEPVIEEEEPVIEEEEPVIEEEEPVIEEEEPVIEEEELVLEEEEPVIEEEEPVVEEEEPVVEEAPMIMMLANAPMAAAIDESAYKGTTPPATYKTYNSIKTTIDEKIVNNSNVLNAIDEWQAAATDEDVGRTPTSHWISITGGANVDVTIDNIWSDKHDSQTAAGITVNTSETSITILRLKGDSRICSLRYFCKNKQRLYVTSADGDKEKSGSLTVIGNQTGVRTGGNGAYKGPEGNNLLPMNHWDSVIGSTDSSDSIYGLYFLGGTVYAGSTLWDNCTSIGGGGNGHGEVFIHGGSITAVSASTGTAIGGGIAHFSYGGTANITITDGEVYAYNHGQPYSDTLIETGNGGLNDIRGQVGYSDDEYLFVPGTAIGGGSSVKSTGSKGVVKISGGTVYAESVGGSGIGGGNSIIGKGGDAEVTITDGNIISKSIAGIGIDAGTGIGGGSNVSKPNKFPGDDDFKSGGYAKVTISGGELYANGIGGGNSRNAYGGDATIDISGGTITADMVGGGFSQTYGYARGNATVTGSTMNTMMAAVPVNASGEQVFLTRASVYLQDELQTDKEVTAVTVEGVTNYGMNDVKTDEKGMLYLWIPAETALTACSLKDIEGHFIAEEEVDMEIDAKDIGILKNDKESTHYKVDLIPSSFYELYQTYQDEKLTDEITNTKFVTSGTLFTYYLKTGKGESGNYYSVQPYVAVDDPNLGKVFQRTAAMDEVTDHLYTSQMVISSDTQIWYEVKCGDPGDEDYEHYFALDLANGNIRVTEDDYGITIEQNGYKLTGFQGGIYLTSVGYPTENSLTVDIGTKNVDVLLDNIAAARDESVIHVETGNLNLSFSEKDNIIQANSGAPITVGQSGTIQINAEKGTSLKLDAAMGSPAVSGTGTVIINDEDGFLKVNELNIKQGDSSAQFEVGTYIYKGDHADFIAELYGGSFNYKLIGYLSESKDKIYNADSMQEGNTENFYARGIYKVYTGVVDDDTEHLTDDGDYQVTIRKAPGYDALGDVEIRKQYGGVLTQGVDYTYDPQTGVIKIFAEAFADGHLTIMAAAFGLIPHEGLDYDGIYDAKEHGISVEVNEDQFQVYYSLTPLNISGKTGDPVTDAMVTEITKASVDNYFYTDVTIDPDETQFTLDPVEVYWYILEKNPPTGGRKYRLACGMNTVTIKQAQNSWIEELTCSDVVWSDSEHAPNPQALAKWGDASKYFKYYEDAAGTIEITDAEKIKNLPVGVYYVKAFVDEPTPPNYTAIESDMIRFRVFETKVFTDVTRLLKQAINPDTTISVAQDGAFSVYYETLSADNMALRINTHVNAGTRLTMIAYPIDGSDQTKPLYYYHIVSSSDYSGSDTVVKVTDFVQMGYSKKDDEYYYVAPKKGNQVYYQFCVDFDDKGTAIWRVSLDGMSGSTVSVQTLDKKEAYFTAEPVASSEEGMGKVTVNVVAKGAGTKILAFRIPELIADGESVVRLSDGTLPALVRGDLFLFKIGEDTASIEKQSYTLVFGEHALDTSKTYEVECDVRVFTPGELLYALAGENSQNNKKVSVTVSPYEKTALYADIVSDRVNLERIIKDAEQTLTFDISTNETSIEGITAKLYVKRNGNYVAASKDVSGLAVDGKEVTLTWPAGLGEGTYRIVFTLNESTCNYNMIVSNR